MKQKLGSKAVEAAQSLSVEQVRDLDVKDKHVERLRSLNDSALEYLERRGAATLGTTPEQYKSGQTMMRIRGFAIGLVVVGVTLTIGLRITSELGNTINDTEAQQGASDATAGLTELPGFLPIIGLVVAAAAVISLVSGSFSRAGTRGMA